MPRPARWGFLFMSEQNNNLPVITPDVAKQKLAIELTKISLPIQKMQDEADSLVFNEDNLPVIGEFIGKMKKAEKAIEDAHKLGKEPFLEGGRAWDAAKKDILSLIAAVKSPVTVKHTEMCNEIDRRNREAEAKKEAEKKIKDGIESNVMEFSGKIAACTTKTELTNVERSINLEKSPSRAGKYGDFHQLAIDRYDEILIPILKDQKKKIDEKDELEAKLSKAENPLDHEALKEKLEEKQNEIIQNSVKVQEQALLQPTISVIEPEVIVTEVKAKRTDIVVELVDVAAAFKKQSDLLNIELKVSEAKKLGKVLQDSGAFGISEEIIVNGIKYTIKKSW